MQLWLQLSRTVGHGQETKPKNHGVEGVEIWTKVLANIFSKIIAVNFPNLGKGIDIPVQ
jgi:hypothetical protein